MPNYVIHNFSHTHTHAVARALGAPLARMHLRHTTILNHSSQNPLGILSNKKPNRSTTKTSSLLPNACKRPLTRLSKAAYALLWINTYFMYVVQNWFLNCEWRMSNAPCMPCGMKPATTNTSQIAFVLMNGGRQFGKYCYFVCVFFFICAIISLWQSHTSGL